MGIEDFRPVTQNLCQLLVSHRSEIPWASDDESLGRLHESLGFPDQSLAFSDGNSMNHGDFMMRHCLRTTLSNTTDGIVAQ